MPFAALGPSLYVISLPHVNNEMHKNCPILSVTIWSFGQKLPVSDGDRLQSYRTTSGLAILKLVQPIWRYTNICTCPKTPFEPGLRPWLSRHRTSVTKRQ